MSFLLPLGQFHVSGYNRRMKSLLTLAALVGFVLLALGCYGSTPPVVKLGLIAPFEERYRDDGYAALHAVRLAVQERNAAGGVAGRQVAVVALNDNGRPDEARQRAANLAVDRDVLGVIGPLQRATADAAGPLLAAQSLAWIPLASAAPVEQPGDWAASAYEAANRLLDAMERAGRQRGDLTRPAVLQALNDLDAAGWLRLDTLASRPGW
jgi:ABC-type branched-subunit amino acid transport system substrate-binding protein